MGRENPINFFFWDVLGFSFLHLHGINDLLPGVLLCTSTLDMCVTVCLVSQVRHVVRNLSQIATDGLSVDVLDAELETSD